MKTSAILIAAVASVLRVHPVAGQRNIRGGSACELGGTWVPVEYIYRMNSVHGKPPFVSYHGNYALFLEHVGVTSSLQGVDTIREISQELIGFHDPADCGFRLVSTTSSTTYVGRMQLNGNMFLEATRTGDAKVGIAFAYAGEFARQANTSAVE